MERSATIKYLLVLIPAFFFIKMSYGQTTEKDTIFHQKDVEFQNTPDENGNFPVLYPYDESKRATKKTTATGTKSKIELLAPDHPGNKTIKEGEEQAKKNKPRDESSGGE